MARSRAVSSTMWLVFPAASGFQPMRNAALRPSLRVQAATLCQPHQNFPLLSHTPRSTSDGDLRLAVLGGPTQVGPWIGWLNCITLSNEGRSEQRALSRLGACGVDLRHSEDRSELGNLRGNKAGCEWQRRAHAAGIGCCEALNHAHRTSSPRRPG